MIIYVKVLCELKTYTNFRQYYYYLCLTALKYNVKSPIFLYKVDSGC